MRGEIPAGLSLADSPRTAGPRLQRRRQRAEPAWARHRSARAGRALCGSRGSSLPPRHEDPVSPSPSKYARPGRASSSLRTDAFQGTSGLLPGLRDLDGIARDQLEGGAARESLPQHHSLLNALELERCPRLHRSWPGRSPMARSPTPARSMPLGHRPRLLTQSEAGGHTRSTRTYVRSAVKPPSRATVGASFTRQSEPVSCTIRHREGRGGTAA